ncbi:hypothetical protein EJB05_36175, partial [Eragrostis curvula]
MRPRGSPHRHASYAPFRRINGPIRSSAQWRRAVRLCGWQSDRAVVMFGLLDVQFVLLKLRVPVAAAMFGFTGISRRSSSVSSSKSSRRVPSAFFLKLEQHGSAVQRQQQPTAGDMSSLRTLLLLCSLILAAPAKVGEIIFFDGNDQIFLDCPSNTNYTSGSAFQANLDVLLSTIPGAAAASYGLAENVTGAAPDQVYGLAQCRADVNAFHCQACLDSLAQYMATYCPGQKRATIVYDDCLLRHSNESFFGAGDTSEIWYVWNSQNATQPAHLTSTLGALMKNITAMAAYASPRMFAAGSAALTPFKNIYGMAQCTRDLSAGDCNRCLTTAIAFIPACCNEKQGGQIVYRSCSIRFEKYPFYNVSAAEAAMSPAPSPKGGPINGSDHFVAGSTGESKVSGLLSPVPLLTRF